MIGYAKRCAWRAGLVIATLSSGITGAQLGGAGPSVSVETFTRTDGVHPGGVLHVAVGVTVEEGWHVNAHKPLEDYLIPTAVEIAPLEGVSFGATVYPEPKTITGAFSATPLAVYGGTFYVGLTVGVSEEVAPGAHALKGVLTYQACNDTQCFAPSSKEISVPFVVRPASETLNAQHEDKFVGIDFAGAMPVEPPRPEETGQPRSDPSLGDDAWREHVDEFDVVAVTTGFQRPEVFATFLGGSGEGPAASGAAVFAGKSLWLVMILVLGGGLLLNLTPCVLPLIPINLGIIGAGAQAGSRSRGFALGGLYGLAIALVYGILGLIVILGLSRTFGSINATPVFNAAIAVVFVVLGLAMFDVFLIDFTRFQAKLGIKRKSGGSFVLAFFMGAVSALLAGACVAPAVISTILFSQERYAAGAHAALALPFVLGVGMALPWPFAGAGLSFLPKPGAWMVRVKQALGVFILAFAVYYGYTAVSLWSGRHFAAGSRAPGQAGDETEWTSSLEAGLARAQREGKPVLIDFWATWCKNCRAMDEVTFKSPKVRAMLGGYVGVKYQAEDPADSRTRAVLDHFNVLGLPTYVVLRPRGPAVSPSRPGPGAE